jgi:hypothetical protein
MEAVKDMLKRKEKGKKISDLAGSWKMTNAEFTNIKTSINESWQKWNPEQ